MPPECSVHCRPADGPRLGGAGDRHEETTMKAAEVLSDAFGRLPDLVHSAVADLTVDQLHERIGGANNISWLVWHLSRVEDDHIAGAAGADQVWTSDGWAERFGLGLPVETTGWSMSSAEVDQVAVNDPELLLGYFDAAHAKAAAFVAELTDGDLDRVVDERWDPPVTLGVRLVSVLDDCLEHAAQAHFVRGILEARDA